MKSAAQLQLIDGGAQQVEQGDEVGRVFEYWKIVMEKQKAQLGDVRRRKIGAALRMGYTVDDIQLAIVGCKFDNWSQGENDRQMKYDDIELICRDETKIDRYMELGRNYLARIERVERERHEREQPGVKMPDDVRARLDAILSRHRKKSGG